MAPGGNAIRELGALPIASVIAPRSARAPCYASPSRTQ